MAPTGMLIQAPKMSALLLSIGLLGGCGSHCCLSIPFSDDDAVHYLILGVGLVTIPKPGTETAVLSTKTQTLGLNLSDQPGLKMGIGYSSSTVVAIPDGAEDVRVEVSQKPGGPIVVDTQTAKLKH